MRTTRNSRLQHNHWTRSAAVMWPAAAGTTAGRRCPGEATVRKIGGPQQLHKVQHLPQHVRGNLDNGEKKLAARQVNNSRWVMKSRSNNASFANTEKLKNLNTAPPFDDHHLC